MSDRLRNVLSYDTLAPGETRSLPHHLVLAGHPLIPDEIDVMPTTRDIMFAVDENTVTVTNNGGAVVSFVALLSYWHPIRRLFGQGNTSLLPRPFVIGAGAGDQSDDPGAFSQVNGDSVPLIPGMPVALITDRLFRARSDTGTARALVAGILVVGAAPNTTATALAEGPLALTTAQWDLVVLEPGGLAPGAAYFACAQPGKISTSPPTTPGMCLVGVGLALSDTVLLVKPQPVILL